LLFQISHPQSRLAVKYLGEYAARRDLDGNAATFEAYYDTVLDITWLADAEYSVTPGSSDYSAIIYMSWSAANAWAAGLNPYGSGITGWRLPTVSPVDGTTADDAYPNTSYIGTEDLGLNISAPARCTRAARPARWPSVLQHARQQEPCDPVTSTVTSCDTQTGWA